MVALSVRKFPFLEVSPSSHALPFRTSMPAIDSLFGDFLQEISERRSPHEHAMGSTWHDCVGMLDVCLLKLVLELCYVLSDDFIVSAYNDVEKDQSLIDLFSVR